MRYRTLGHTGLRVSEIFLGAMRFDDLEAARAVVDHYADAGGNVVDTAVNYGGGESERILGELLAGRRDRFVLATKYTCSRDVTDPNAAGSHRKNLVASLETSLRRLRTDHIDLYWVHVWDRRTPVEETMRALDDAVRAGKISYVGVSDVPAWYVARANTLAEWRDWSPFRAIQVPYNLLDRDVERELLPMAAALGVAVTAWGPLAHGVLAGGRREGPSPGTRAAAAVSAVAEVAAELGTTPARVALAWLLGRAAHPILGARTAAQLADGLGAVELALPAEVVARLEAAAPVELGFPGDFVAAAEAEPWVFGAAGRVAEPAATVAPWPPTSSRS